MDNPRIAEAFDELADLLDLGGHNPHKSRAYRAFSATVRGLGEPLEAIWARGEAAKLAGVGKAIEGKVAELLETGGMGALDRARVEVPPSLLELLRVPGLGSKRVRALWQGLGIATLAELAYACRENRLVALPGFGEKTQERTLGAVTFLLEAADRVVLGRALDLGRALCAALRDGGASQAEIAGEARRGVEQVTEVVVVARGIDAHEARDALVGHEPVESAEVVSAEMLRVTCTDKTKVRVRVTQARDWVAALLVETGDAPHIRWLSEQAKGQGDDLVTIAERSIDEAAVYRALGLVPVPPELREGVAPEVPEDLLPRRGLSGIFHAHTEWSDGSATIAAMAGTALANGAGYLGITEHSKAAVYARGLDSARLREQADAIAQARKLVPGIDILHGVEVDILRDGSLDLDDDTLAALDFVIASVHTSMDLPADEMTTRLVRALSHPLVTILGHPTGRLLLGRKGFAFDLAVVTRAAVANDTYLEINASPYRLDLSDAMVRRAAAAGARFAVDPDAHSTAGLADAELGVLVARRARLSPAQVLNAGPREGVLASLAARKARALARMGR